MKTISFITRISRTNVNIQAIYDSIISQFENFYWLIYIEANTIETPLTLKELASKDKRIIINTSVKRQNNQDVHFNKSIDVALNSKYVQNSKWFYVLDDDNILHENLSQIIDKNSDADLIINRLVDKRNVNYINNPQNLTINYCVGHVDWASTVFLSSFFQQHIKHINPQTDASDGETVLAYLQHHAKTVYTNEVGGYYNYLR